MNDRQEERDQLRHIADSLDTLIAIAIPSGLTLVVLTAFVIARWS